MLGCSCLLLRAGLYLVQRDSSGYVICSCLLLSPTVIPVACCLLQLLSCLFGALNGASCRMSPAVTPVVHMDIVE